VKLIQPSISSSPIHHHPLRESWQKGKRLLGRNNCRKIEEARDDQRPKPFLTHLRQQVLREEVLIPAAVSQLITEQL